MEVESSVMWRLKSSMCELEEDSHKVGKLRRQLQPVIHLPASRENHLWLQTVSVDETHLYIF